MDAATETRPPSAGRNTRGLHTIIAMAILAVGAFTLTKWITPQLLVGDTIGNLEKYLG